MHKRKVTKEGRVTIPIEFMEQFRIKENDFVVVTANRQHILLKKYRETNVCSVTGKVSAHLTKVGEAYVSKEGFEILKKTMDESDI
ncbi:MAG: AbrB/MazE/SpoVT family DNA-binding domain-containing protein [Carnobacterium alterfunditum]